MYQGTVLASELNIRPQANTTQSPLGKLLKDDKVEADTVSAGWWHLTKITRAGANVALPAANSYSYEGATKGYIRTDAVIQPPASDPVTVEVNVNGVVVYSYP